jgi:hypothetical protein
LRGARAPGSRAAIWNSVAGFAEQLRLAPFFSALLGTMPVT